MTIGLRFATDRRGLGAGTARPPVGEKGDRDRTTWWSLGAGFRPPRSVVRAGDIAAGVGVVGRAVAAAAAFTHRAGALGTEKIHRLLLGFVPLERDMGVKELFSR